MTISQSFDPLGPAPVAVRQGFTHIDHSTCPVCRTQMADAKLPDDEPIKFCPMHGISLPQLKDV